MRHVATPGEVAGWLRFLDPLPEHRRAPVIRMLSEVVSDCPVCEEPVRRCDRRALDIDEQLGHLQCIGGGG